MLYWAFAFFVIAVIAALFGFGGIAAGAANIAQVLFFLFLVLFVVSLLMGLIRRRARAVAIGGLLSAPAGGVSQGPARAV